MVAWDRNKVVNSKSNLEGAELKSFDLSGLDLSKANLISANLVSANLKEVSLVGANLFSVKAMRADFSCLLYTSPSPRDRG